MATQKHEAEQWAARLKGKYAPETPVIQLSEIYYGNGKSAYEGLVSAMRVNLLQGDAPERDPSTRETLEHSIVTAQAFIEFAKSAYDDTAVVSPRGLGDIVAKIFPALLKATGDMYQHFRQAQADTRDKLLQELDRLRWREFRAIPKAISRIDDGCSA